MRGFNLTRSRWWSKRGPLLCLQQTGPQNATQSRFPSGRRECVRSLEPDGRAQLDLQSLAAQSVGVLIGIPSFIAGKLLNVRQRGRIVLQPSPFVALLISISVIATFQIGYVVAAMPPSPASTMLMQFAPSLALVFWIDADARQRRRTPCYDFGLLMVLFFPASLIWYPVWSRGGWGFLSLIGLLTLMCVPYFSATVVWDLLYGGN